MVKTRWQTITITILCNNKWDEGWELFLCWKGNANPVPIVFNVLPWGVERSLSFFFKGSSLFSFGGDTHIHTCPYTPRNLYMNASNYIYIHNSCPLKVSQRLGAESHPRHPHQYPYNHSTSDPENIWASFREVSSRLVCRHCGENL